MHRCVGVNYCILLGTCTCRMASVARSPPSLHSSHARCSKGINTSNTFLCINPNKIHFRIWNQEASIDQEYGHESNHRILRFWSKLWKNVVHFRSNVISPSHLCQVCVAHCSDIAEVLSGSNKCILYFSDKPHLYSLLLLVALGMRMMFFLGIQILCQMFCCSLSSGQNWGIFLSHYLTEWAFFSHKISHFTVLGFISR